MSNTSHHQPSSSVSSVNPFTTSGLIINPSCGVEPKMDRAMQMDCKSVAGTNPFLTPKRVKTSTPASQQSLVVVSSSSSTSDSGKISSNRSRGAAPHRTKRQPQANRRDIADCHSKNNVYVACVYKDGCNCDGAIDGGDAGQKCKSLRIYCNNQYIEVDFSQFSPLMLVLKGIESQISIPQWVRTANNNNNNTADWGSFFKQYTDYDDDNVGFLSAPTTEVAALAKTDDDDFN